MTKRKTDKSSITDPLESVIEDALMPGDFIGYNSSWSFVSDLEVVQKQIDAVIGKDPLRAVDLIETFIAGCYEKAEEVDDSGGNFGMFVEDLFCCWVKARQKADFAPKDTVEQKVIQTLQPNYIEPWECGS